jgi:hypothetical protein
MDAGGAVRKTIDARDVGWSIIDTDYSPDQQFLIYSSWSPYVHLCNVFQSEGTELHLPLDFRSVPYRRLCASAVGRAVTPTHPHTLTQHPRVHSHSPILSLYLWVKQSQQCARVRLLSVFRQVFQRFERDPWRQLHRRTLCVQP